MITDFDKSDRSYDYAIYVLECDVPDVRPPIQTKYLKSKEQFKQLEEVPIRYVIPPENKKHTGVHLYHVTNKWGEKTYPLYLEFAVEADKVYYIGQAEILERRIRQHFHPSREQDRGFLRFADIKQLIEVIFIGSDNKYSSLLEVLEAEARIKLRSGVAMRTHIESNYNELIESLCSENRDINAACRELETKADVAQINHIEPTDCSPKNIANELERDTAVDYINLHKKNSGDTIPVDEIASYSYWN